MESPFSSRVKTSCSSRKKKTPLIWRHARVKYSYQRNGKYNLGIKFFDKCAVINRILSTLKDRSINTTRDYVICTAKKTIFCMFFIRFVNKVDRACLEQRESESKKAPIKFRLIYCSRRKGRGEPNSRKSFCPRTWGDNRIKESLNKTEKEQEKSIFKTSHYTLR